jgi:hypothetical protein
MKMTIGNTTLEVKVSTSIIRRQVMSDVDLAYIELNNTYLRIERGEEKMTIHNRNNMCILVGLIYAGDPDMRDWWYNEIEKLPGALDC